MEAQACLSRVFVLVNGAFRFSGHCSGGCKFLIHLFLIVFLPLVNAPVEKLIFYSFIIAFNLYNVYSWRGRGYIVFGGVHFLWGWFCFLPLGRHFFIGSLGDCCSLVAWDIALHPIFCCIKETSLWTQIQRVLD